MKTGSFVIATIGLMKLSTMLLCPQDFACSTPRMRQIYGPRGTRFEADVERSMSVSSRKKARMNEMPARMAQSQKAHGQTTLLTMKAAISGPK